MGISPSRFYYQQTSEEEEDAEEEEEDPEEDRKSIKDEESEVPKSPEPPPAPALAPTEGAPMQAGGQPSGSFICEMPNCGAVSICVVPALGGVRVMQPCLVLRAKDVWQRPAT